MPHVGKKVLVVDDEDILRMLLADTLEFEGFIVEEAEDGRQGYEMIKENAYDAILLDYMMPHLTGLEVLQKVQPLGLTAPIIMLTAKAQQTDKEEALENGAAYFVAKPFSPNDLAELLKSLF